MKTASDEREILDFRNGAPLDRRQLLAGMALGAGAALATGSGAATANEGAGKVREMPAQRRWSPLPVQSPATESLYQAGRVKLSAWDTGGSGEVVVLIHPATGSSAIWGHQQPELVKAGYRVIAYSRRAHGQSEPGPADDETSAVDDLVALMDAMKVDRFHAVGFALGGYVPPDVAISHPGRLLSMTLACTHGGATDADFRRRVFSMMPKPFSEMPASFRELGPTYRAANPEGTSAWEALERVARPGPAPRFRAKNNLQWPLIETIKTPALIVAGGADLYMPAPFLLEYAQHLQSGESVVIAECGHSAYWEQPIAFNAALLDFLGRHRAG